MADYAYCRVSSKEQNLDRQLCAMKARDIPEKNIFCEKQSGADFDNRSVYQKLKKKLRYGDNLTIMSLDRLGRNYSAVLHEWRDITDIGCGIVVIDMPLLNTAQDYGLTGRLVADIVLQLLAYVAEQERTFIKERQRQGIAAARAKGVHLGRKPDPKPEQWPEILRRINKHELSVYQAADIMDVPRTTVYYWVKQERGRVNDGKEVDEQSKTH